MAEDAAYLAQYNGGPLEGTAIAFLALTYVSVGLRTYVRAYLTKGFLLDDWLMLAAQAIFTVSCVFVLLGVKNGMGRHDKALPTSVEVRGAMWQALATATYILNMMFIKLSIGFFLLRLAVQRRYTYTIWASMSVVLVWSLTSFFWDLFQCSPIQAQWDASVPNPRCVSPSSVVDAAYALSVMTIVSDWLYALLPIPMIWQVKMSTQSKATVVVILGMGIFASVATLIRLKYLATLEDSSDILYAGTDAMVWTLVEPGVAIVASSLVTIRPLLRQMRLKGFESTGASPSAPYTGPSRSGGTGGLGSRSTKSAGRKRAGYGGMPGGGPDDVALQDVEKAYGGGRGKKGRRLEEEEEEEGTLTSKASSSTTTTITAGGGKTAWGGTVGITLREADEEGEEDERIVPAAGDGGGARSEASTLSGDVFVIEGAAAAQQGGRQLAWAGETPQSSEESEHIQGLTYPSRRDAAGRMPSRYSVPEFPLGVHR